MDCYVPFGVLTYDLNVAGPGGIVGGTGSAGIGEGLLAVALAAPLAVLA